VSALENKDEKLMNLLKLKQAIAKDLAKSGKVIKREERRIELPKELKQRKIEVSNVDFSKVETLRDIDMQDYDAPDYVVIRDLEKYLQREMDVLHSTMLKGLLKLLQLDYESASRLFEDMAVGGNSKAAYNYAESLMFMNYSKGAVSFISQFSKTVGADVYTYLSILEVMTYFSISWDKMEKILEVFANRDTPMAGVLRMARSMALGKYEEAKNDYSKLVRSGKYKGLLDIYSMMIYDRLDDKERATQLAKILINKKQHCCSFVHSSTILGNQNLPLDKFPHCRFLRVEIAKKKYMMGAMNEAMKTLEPLMKENDPSALALLGTIHFSTGDHDEAERVWMKLSETVPTRIIVGSTRMRSRANGLAKKLLNEKMLVVEEGVTTKMEEEFRKILRDGMNPDFRVDHVDIEPVRLFFGERTCKRISLEREG